MEVDEPFNSSSGVVIEVEPTPESHYEVVEENVSSGNGGIAVIHQESSTDSKDNNKLISVKNSALHGDARKEDNVNTITLNAADTNWKFAPPDFSLSIINRFCLFREQSMLIDVIISVKNKDFPCHKIILASCSDFFCEFFLQTAGKKTDSGGGSVEKFVVNEIPISTMEQFLEFAYTGAVTINRKNVQNLQTAAEFFKAPLLAKGCAEFIRNHMYTITVCGSPVEAPTTPKHDMTLFLNSGHRETNTQDVEVYICDKCNQTFRTKLNLTIHMKTHISIAEDSESSDSGHNHHFKKRDRDPKMHNFTCDVCGRGYKLKHSLNEHKRKHTNPLICSTCGKAFGRPDHLRLHEVTHLTHKSFSCSFCDGKFSSEKTLQNHKCKNRDAKIENRSEQGF